MQEIDKFYLLDPCLGSRKYKVLLEKAGYQIAREKVRRLMKLMGISAIYCKPKTTISRTNHYKYPYLLKDLKIKRSNQVWTSDITYIPMSRGFMYLTVVFDWFSRKVLTWQLSNTLESDFCLEALEEALRLYQKPEIFNTDQGVQYTSGDFTQRLESEKIAISMDGKGRYLDNIMNERLWRTLKYDYLYLHSFDTVTDLKKGLHQFINYYNSTRPHQHLNYQTPNQTYFDTIHLEQSVSKSCLNLTSSLV